MKTKKINTKLLARLGLLMAVTVILAATPLGYIYLPFIGLSLTIMVLPVAIGGGLMGIPSGLILGLTFGITSLLKAPTEALGQLMLGYSALVTVIVCVVPRILVGLVAGLFSKKLQGNGKLWQYALCGAAASLTNTLLFVGLVYVFCRPLVEGAFGVVVWSTTLVGGLGEAALAAVLCALVMKPLNKILVVKI